MITIETRTRQRKACIDDSVAHRPTVLERKRLQRRDGRDRWLRAAEPERHGHADGHLLQIGRRARYLPDAPVVPPGRRGAAGGHEQLPILVQLIDVARGRRRHVRASANREPRAAGRRRGKHRRVAGASP